MPRDMSLSRVPFTRIVHVTKPRTVGESADSVVASYRGDDLSTTEAFSPANFAAFLLTVGENSSDDREQRVQYAIKCPDTDRWYTAFFNSLPPTPQLRKVRIVAAYSGDTDMILKTNTVVVIGQAQAFPELAQMFVEPETTPSELPAPVGRYSFGTGQFEFEEVFSGWIKVTLHGTLFVDVGADVPVQWTLQRSAGAGGSWVDYWPLGDDSYRTTATPVIAHYETPWLQHLKHEYYRIRALRTTGPAGDMTVTLRNPWIEATMLIRGA